MNPAVDPLADLRGYHLPEPVSWWPPAPGWWLLGLLLLLLVAAAARWLAGRYQRGAPTRAARAELAGLRAALARDGDSAAYARGLSRLLRRYAIARFPGSRVAGLSGEDWLDFLDAHGGEGRFRRGPGRVLIDLPYRSAGDLPEADLAGLVESWILSNRGAAR